MQQIRQQIEQAQHILIVGGGPCGIELAGEIRDEYLDKRLTIIHSQPQLGNASYIPLHYHRQLLHLLESSNVNVLLNDRAILPAQRQQQTAFVPAHPLPATRNGADLSDVDFVFLASSSKPNVDWVQASFPDLVAENGFVKVKSSLQVDHPTLAHSVFVIGDVAALPETKMAYRAANSHAPIAAANIIKLLQDPDASYDSLKKYKKAADMMLITFGKVSRADDDPRPPSLHSQFSL
jgi:NADH dehydrogenase FAD-containing subunit